MSVSEMQIEAGARAIDPAAFEQDEHGCWLQSADRQRALKASRACLTAALSDQVVVPKNAKPAFWTHDAEAAKDVGHLYYFAPTDRAKPPYRHQRHVNAIIDIAADGTLAGVELIDDMPPPPSSTAGEVG